MHSHVRVKICGITNEKDARAAVACGADALGLNFYPNSPRYVAPKTAAGIARLLPPFVDPIALFVNATWEHMTTAVSELPWIRTIQHHGDPLDKPPQSNWRFISAFSIKSQEDLTSIQRYLDGLLERPAAILVDAHVP